LTLDPEGDPDNDFTPIVLVNRGGCSFVRKTRNIQDIGGKLVLIADSRANADPSSVIMVDDGTGSNIAIPTIMITKEEGESLRDAIIKTEAENNKPGAKKDYVVLDVQFEIV